MRRKQRKAKRQAAAGSQTQNTTGLSRQHSATEPQQPDNPYNPLYMVLTASVTYLAAKPGCRLFHFHYFCLIKSSKFIYFQHEARCSEQVISKSLKTNLFYLTQVKTCVIRLVVPTGASELLCEEECSTSIPLQCQIAVENSPLYPCMVSKLLAFAHEIINCILLLMTAEVLISWCQRSIGQRSIYVSDVQDCQPRLSSALDLLLIFLCSLIPNPNPNPTP